jgi:hypothetical protein
MLMSGRTYVLCRASTNEWLVLLGYLCALLDHLDAVVV